MLWRKIISILVMGLVCMAPVQAATWFIGVQAPNGASAAQQQWQPWVDWLAAQFPHDDFSLVALNTQDFQQSLQSNRLDFVIAQPLQLLLLPQQPQMHWLASLEQNDQANSISGDRVGSAIWVRRDSQLFVISQLNRKHIAAVSEQAFGGYLGGMAVLQQNGIQEHDVKTIFTQYPVSNTLQRLQDAQVDAAITPLCLMEQLQQAGKIDISQFRLIEPSLNQGGCQGNIEFPANWLLAAMPNTSAEMSKQVARVVLTVDAPKALPRWQIPQSTMAIEQVLLQLGHHPHQRNVWQTLRFYINKYWYWWMVAGVMVILLLLSHGLAVYLARRRQAELKQIYRDLARTEHMMYHADRVHTLGEMMSGIGHELNQPLTAIHYYADGLRLKMQRQALKTEEIQAALSQIVKHIDSSRTMIQNIRQWGKTLPSEHKQHIALQPLLIEVQQFVSWQHQQLQLTLECRPNTHVLAEPLKLKQILVNCVLNSIQAGATAVRIKAVTGRLDIIDNGGGFEPEQLDFPFVPFRTTRSEGLGIGLVVCERLAKSMDMTLRLANHQEGGAVVTLQWDSS